MSDLGFAAQLAEDLSLEDLQLVLGVFRSDVQRLGAALVLAVGDGDEAGFRRAAHALAGAAGAVGAAALERACRQGMAGMGALEGLAAEIRALAESALAEVAAILAALEARP